MVLFPSFLTLTERILKPLNTNITLPLSMRELSQTKKRKRKTHGSKDMNLLRMPNLLYILLILIAVPLIYDLVFYRIELAGEKDMYDLSGECSLSLCDCRCYLTEELPEVKESKICGNDCYSMMGIKGCELVGGECELILEN